MARQEVTLGYVRVSVVIIPSCGDQTSGGKVRLEAHVLRIGYGLNSVGERRSARER